jgi:hypothetical protein
MANENKLNLPAIHSSKGIVKPQSDAKKISPFDLSKKSTVSKILKKEESSLQQELINKNRGLDLILVGDLTGSMSAYHRLLKEKFSSLCKDMFQLIQNLRIGIIFYLDHGSGDPYVTTICQPTIDSQKLLSFIQATPTGNGGDADEAVEEALHDLLQNIQWKELHNRSVVLFGDASPHPKHHCPNGLDFWELTKQLYHANTTVNSVFCGYEGRQKMQDVYSIGIGDFDTPIEYLVANQFFSWIANVTGGMAINIENVDDLIDIIITSAAKDAGKLADLEAKVKAEPRKLNLIKLAKEAESRKISYIKNRKLLE